MRSAIGLETCEPSCVCRPSGGDSIAALDALLCLAMAVSLPVSTYCPCDATTTTTLPPPSGACTDTEAFCTSDLECLYTCHLTCSEKAEAGRAHCYDPDTCAEACAGCTSGTDLCSRRCFLCRDGCRTYWELRERECHWDCRDDTCEGLPDTPRFEDTGLTIRDHSTRLEWEKKTDANVEDYYAYTATDLLEIDFPLIGNFLAALNNRFVAGGCFAGHCDWRMPTVAGDKYDTGDRGELESIRVVTPECSTNWDLPCIDPVFGPTIPDEYWSTSQLPGRDDVGIALRFHSSVPIFGYPLPWYARYVRAVREF